MQTLAGTRRIAAELADEGIKAGRQEMRAAMKRENLVAIQPKRFVPQTTDSTHGKLASPNLLAAVENQPATAAEVVIGERHLFTAAKWSMVLFSGVAGQIYTANYRLGG